MIQQIALIPVLVVMLLLGLIVMALIAIPRVLRNAL